MARIPDIAQSVVHLRAVQALKNRDRCIDDLLRKKQIVNSRPVLILRKRRPLIGLKSDLPCRPNFLGIGIQGRKRVRQPSHADIPRIQNTVEVCCSSSICAP